MRVLVHRAEAASRKTVEALAAAGQEAVLAPVTRIMPTDAALGAVTSDAILATSANAFASPAERFENLRHRPLFVVGQATREAARQAGFRDIRSSEGDAAALVTLVRLTLPRPAHLLYLAGHDRKPVMERALAEAGYTLQTIEAYEAEAVEAWPDEVIQALMSGTIDVALHFSRRSTELALGLAERHGALDPYLVLRHVCLSEDVAAPLRVADAPRIDVAKRPDEASLLARLDTGGA